MKITIIFRSGRSIHIDGDLTKLLAAIESTPNPDRGHNDLIINGQALINIDYIDCVVPSENVDK